MAKHLKLTIKNTQIAKAVNLGGIKEKLAKKKSSEESLAEELPKEKPIKKKTVQHEVSAPEANPEEAKTESPRIKARSKSVFAEPQIKPVTAPIVQEEEIKAPQPPPAPTPVKSGDELRRKVFGDEAIDEVIQESRPSLLAESPSFVEKAAPVKETPPPPVPEVQKKEEPETVRLGPTGRHIKDFLPPPRVTPREQPPVHRRPLPAQEAPKPKIKPQVSAPSVEIVEEAPKGKVAAKEFRDVKPAKRPTEAKTFDARDRKGLRDADEESRWRKKRSKSRHQQEEIAVVRPTSLKVRVPISIKDLASEMKLKASQLISKLFLQGVIVTLNDLLDDETTIQLLGQEFGCEITIDTSEEQRIRITDQALKEEIQKTASEQLMLRPPVVAFMGHVDHGKTSLIDAIRKSNRAEGEAGAITQHIGAFRCHTDVGDITILDTPGHEAFSAMRARGADVTDIVVLVVAGDEGMRQQTFEAVEHARTAKVTIVVAINKADKPNFNPENVYRQLADHDLLPEVWGGQTLTVNCSAVTGKGIKELLETLALQAEIMELKASPSARARGMVIESEMHKGLGAAATVLVQNGTLKMGDALVFGQHWGRVKTMKNEFGHNVAEAGPSTPVSITGLSGVPEAGQEFIVVKNEREAREIAEARLQGMRQLAMQQRKLVTAENLLQQATPTQKKILHVILRADVQGSLEALKTGLEKINSQKVDVNVISATVGEVTESDIQLAGSAKAIVLGFHTGIEAHAEPYIKQFNVVVRLHEIIYHAIDDVKDLMKGLLDKIAQETDKGKAQVKALFKSSQAGVIAGCMVTDGTIHRNNHLRIIRNGSMIAKTQISSLRRVKEDVREVSKGQECGIVLAKFTDLQEEDVLEAYEVTYIEQEI